MADLAAFLAQATRTPFAWGRRDCCLLLADWLVACGRPDPAADLRGRYRTEHGCARVLRRQGGLLAVVARCATRAELAPTSTPGAGDVGVIEALTAQGVRELGALCTGPRWAVLGPRGVISLPAQVVAAWSV